MKRSLVPEMMDSQDMSPAIVRAFHTELARLNVILGNNAQLMERLSRDPPRTVLDIGCGHGALLVELRDTLGVEVQGIDLRPAYDAGVPVVVADATRDELPPSDVALCILTVHHMTEMQIVDLVRNVGRYCARFIILDLVRHPLPLFLYATFIWPLVSRLVMVDGIQSIRRAYTPVELRALVVKGLQGTGSIFEHWVSPIFGKQVIDIRYRA